MRYDIMKVYNHETGKVEVIQKHGDKYGECPHELENGKCVLKECDTPQKADEFIKNLSN